MVPTNPANVSPRLTIPALCCGIALILGAGRWLRAPLQVIGAPTETDDANQCRGCHSYEVDGFARSKMAISMRPGGQEPGYQPARDLLCSLLLKTNQYAEVIDQAAIALQHDPTDQSAIYQEIQAQRRLGNKQAIQPLVQHLEELKRQQQVAQAQYLLQDANTSRSSP